jgi:hypothetical protein
VELGGEEKSILLTTWGWRMIVILRSECTVRVVIVNHRWLSIFHIGANFARTLAFCDRCDRFVEDEDYVPICVNDNCSWPLGGNVRGFQ